MKQIAGLGRMRVALCVLAAGVGCAAAASQPDYRDDRSKSEAVLRSLYNAVERKEYLRAWSYFRDEPGRPGFEAFAKGYADTAHVRLKLGAATSEGAAGSLYFTVPAVVEATPVKGTAKVFAGCYLLRLVQPAIQATPPFQPLGIVKGVLKPSQKSFAEAKGSCAGVE